MAKALVLFGFNSPDLKVGVINRNQLHLALATISMFVVNFLCQFVFNSIFVFIKELHS